MHTYDILKEGLDIRSKEQKLLDMIEHPNTEENIRLVAISKWEQLTGKSYNNDYLVDTILHNVTDQNRHVVFANGLTCNDLLHRLMELKPKPNRVQFLRQGVISMTILPPYNTTKQEYYNQIYKAVGNCRIDSKNNFNYMGNTLSSSYLFSIMFF